MDVGKYLPGYLFSSFSFSGWANVVVWSFQMLIIGNSAQHKGTSSYCLLQVASDPLSTEGFGQKISSKKATFAASKTDLEMMSQFDISVIHIIYPYLYAYLHIYIYQHPHLYLDILYPSIYIPIYNRSPFRSSSQIWSKALATETKPERLERLDVSPWSTKRFNDDPLNPVKTVQMFVKHPVMIKGINSYMNNLWGDFASPFWTATFEQVANVPSCTTGTKMQMVSH